MGGCTFSITAQGKTAQEAYDNLVADAKSYYGNDPHSGTIATTCGFKMYEHKARFGTNAFYAEKDEQYQHLDKWGFCLCIELKGKAAKEAKERLGAKRGMKYFHFFGIAAE